MPRLLFSWLEYLLPTGHTLADTPPPAKPTSCPGSDGSCCTKDRRKRTLIESYNGPGCVLDVF